jgi:Animal haem peroxidase
LYQADGLRLLLGKSVGNAAGVESFDLPRNSGKPARALIGDKRNDENIIVSQLHGAFLRFHNAVVDKLDGTIASSELFDEAHRTVRWHYQWLVLHEFLPLIVGEKLAKQVREGSGGQPYLEIFKPKGSASFMPVEFAVAAYRFGHSMVRPSYSLNTTVLKATGAAEKFDRVPVFSADNAATKPLANLNGFRPLPEFWGIDWSFFFNDLKKPANGPSIPTTKLKIAQPSYRIDSVLADPLAALPEFAGRPAPMQLLAFRNLLRGSRMGLPSGQRVAKLLGITPIADAKLFENRGDPFKPAEDRKALLAHVSGTFKQRAPLWYYILKEAELTTRAGVKDPAGAGHHLGPVGGRIVAEVLTGLVWNDRTSYLRMEPQWKPTLGSGGKFGMADLLKFAGVAR